MSDTVALPPPAERGRLIIHDGVVETIACNAAAAVSQTCRATGLGRLTSNDLPRAHVVVGAGHVVATLVVGARWPTPVATVAERVRDAVIRQVGEFTGLTVARVDVDVRCVPRDEHPTGRRVR